MQKTIILGGGCFWCVEAVYSIIEGVTSVSPGYIDGYVKNPTYKDVSTGLSGHNEVLKLIYDGKIISLEEILEIFWTAHNPTTLNQQGADKGTQYRSGIYFEDPNDEEIIKKSIAEVAVLLWDDPIVTEIKPASTFYPAENYHKDYYQQNSDKSYCQIVINPKLSKVRQKFASKIKK